MATFNEHPPYDLDMSALSLVKTYAHWRGTTYPAMTWEPKQSFRALSGYCGGGTLLEPSGVS
jgi:hypothetical protein